MARRLGATSEQLAAVADGRDGEFPEPWRAALSYAAAITPTRGEADHSTFAALAASWSPAQIVEITAVVCLFNYFNRFALALDVPVTR